jgi:hypothetical protein
LAVLYAVSQVLQYFSYLCWSVGSALNFNQPLTHLDSLYFALGTLTTAGTGNLVATSEAARRLQTVQMALDFVLLVVAIGLCSHPILALDRGPCRSCGRSRRLACCLRRVTGISQMTKRSDAEHAVLDLVASSELTATTPHDIAMVRRLEGAALAFEEAAKRRK